VNGAPRGLADGAGGGFPEVRDRLVQVSGCLADLKWSASAVPRLARVWDNSAESAGAALPALTAA
jgi:hypothetical protein